MVSSCGSSRNLPQNREVDIVEIVLTDAGDRVRDLNERGEVASVTVAKVHARHVGHPVE